MGYRAVTNRTARSPSLYTYIRYQKRDENSKAYRAVAKRKGAYAAITVRDHHGVSGSYEPAIRFLVGYRAVTNRTARSPSLYTYIRYQKRDENSKAYRAVAKRRDAYTAMLALLCALRVNPVFQDMYKSVSRRREKKGRLRCDACSSLCPPCEPCFSRHVQKSIAPSRKERALTPRCLLFSVPSV